MRLGPLAACPAIENLGNNRGADQVFKPGLLLGSQLRLSICRRIGMSGAEAGLSALHNMLHRGIEGLGPFRCTAALSGRAVQVAISWLRSGQVARNPSIFCILVVCRGKRKRDTGLSSQQLGHLDISIFKCGFQWLEYVS